MPFLKTFYNKVTNVKIDGKFDGECGSIIYSQPVSIYGNLTGIMTKQRWVKGKNDYFLLPHELLIYPSHDAEDPKGNVVLWTLKDLMYHVAKNIGISISDKRGVSLIISDPNIDFYFPVCKKHDPSGYVRNKFIESVFATFTYPTVCPFGQFHWAVVYIAYRDPIKYGHEMKFLNSITNGDNKSTNTFFSRYDNFYDLGLIGDLLHLFCVISKSDIQQVNLLLQQNFIVFITEMIHKYGVSPKIMDHLKYYANGKVYTSDDF